MKKKNQAYQTDSDFDSFGDFPSSVSGSGFDSSSGGGSDFPSGSFEDEPQFTPPAPRRQSSRNGQLLVILGVIGALILGAVVFLLIPKGTSGNTAQPGTAAPAGMTAAVDPGRELLLNELLVTADSSVSQKDLEVQLAKLDGAVVGYLPVMNQYQVRFNTDSKKDLDAKKKALKSSAGIIRVDYNYLLFLSSDPASGDKASLSSVPEMSLGLLGGLPPAGETLSASFLLSSSSVPYGVPVADWLKDRASKVLPAYRAERASALLSEAGPQYFASCFFYEENKNGTVAGFTTSCALRYQLYCLVNAGADTIALPFTGPAVLTRDDALKEENELNALFFEALEKTHPSFILCKAWKDGDYLAEALTGTETGKKHVLLISSVDGKELTVLDAAKAGKKVYRTADKLAGSDLAFYGNGETASLRAAAQLASLRAEQPDADAAALKNSLLAACSILAADTDGAVVPGLHPAETAGGKAGSYRLVTLSAVDSRTMNTVSNVTFNVKVGSDSFKQSAKKGKLNVLLPAGAATVSASADNYKSVSDSEIPAKAASLELSLTGKYKVGSVKGKLALAGSGVTEALYATFRNTETGKETGKVSAGKSYRLEMKPGKYDITFSGHNRTSVTVHNVTIAEGAETPIPDVTLSVVSDLPGKASGVISNAVNAAPVEKAKLVFYEGIDAPDTGTAVATVLTGSNGSYSVTLPGGVYTAYISKEGFMTNRITVLCEGEKTIGSQDDILSPELLAGEIRIVLTWGANPYDLDSHLVNRTSNIHIFHGNKKETVDGVDCITLDVDSLGASLVRADGKSNRMETITISRDMPGKFTYYIFDYSTVVNDQKRSNCWAMANSGAKIKVFVGNEASSRYEYDVPNEEGTLWEVFTLENNEITFVNKVSDYFGYDANIGK